jgi:hemoglobin/transferrin/lactoferrin receptor protein
VSTILKSNRRIGVTAPLMAATALAGVLALGFAPKAVAQTADDAETTVVAPTGESGTTQLGRLEVTDTALGEPTPGVNTVNITAEDIDRRNPADMQDLFSAQPSIQVGSSLPISQKLYVNGVEETNLSVTIDGSRQNNKIFHHNATTLIDPALLKAVRVDPGVAPADAGPGALAGSVAYETRSARDLLEPGKAFGGFVKTSYETNGDTFTTGASAYAMQNDFEVLGYLNYADGGLREDGDGDTIIGSKTDLLSGLGKVAYEAESGDRLELSYERVTDDEARPYRANIGRITAGRPVPLTRNYDLERQNVVLTYTDETPVGWWDPTVQLGYSMTDLRVFDDTDVIEGRTDSLNGKIENRFAIGLGSVTAGLDFYSDKASYDYFFLDDVTLNEGGEERASNVGIYAQARLDLTERARLSFGGRGDFQWFTGANDYETENGGFSGNISGEYDLTDILTAKLGYSHVWAGIPLAENFIINENWDYSDGLDPVTADNFTAGLTADFGGYFLEGKLFHTSIDDARTPVYSQGGGGPGLQRDIVSKGFEIGAGVEWASGFARVAYANVDTEIDGRPADSETGRYLTTPIGQIITLQAAHSFLDHGLTIGGDIQFVLKETDTFDSDTFERGEPLPAYEVVNAFVEYTPPQFDNWTLRAEVNNLFDEQYTSRATYGQEFGTVVPLAEPGRSFKLSATARF